MKKILFSLLLMLSPLTAYALSVADIQITSGIENRAPVDLVDIYPAQNGKLYCFSRVEGAQEDTSVQHLWLYQGREMARVSLPVRSRNWRTYSSKKILQKWTGDWQVKILSAAGDELATTNFTVK